jgi:hypothetical protein
LRLDGIHMLRSGLHNHNLYFLVAALTFVCLMQLLKQTVDQFDDFIVVVEFHTNFTFSLNRLDTDVDFEEKTKGVGLCLVFSTLFTGLTTNLSRDVDTAKAHALRVDCVSRQPSFPVIFF